jgi:hypothetical protein
MSVSYVVDIAALILRGPHATMIVGAASGWSQTTLNARTPNPAYRTLFNMAILVLTVEAAGQVFLRLGGTPDADPGAIAIPLAGMALTYFLVNTVPIAIAIALTTKQGAWRIWKTDFASSAPSYALGAVAAAVVIEVTESAGYWLTLLLAAAPLFLTQDASPAGRATRGRARSKPPTTRSDDGPSAQHPGVQPAMRMPATPAWISAGTWSSAPPSDRNMRGALNGASTGAGPLAGRQLEPASGPTARISTEPRSRGSAMRSRRLTGFAATSPSAAPRRVLRQSQKSSIGRLADGVADSTTSREHHAGSPTR